MTRRLKKHELEDAYDTRSGRRGVQSIPSDGPIIAGHVREAVGLLKGAMDCLREIEEKDRARRTGGEANPRPGSTWNRSRSIDR